MGKQFTELNSKHVEFIKNQKLYFVGTAGCEGKINVSPKGMDSFRVINNNKIVWLNLTGSGNETSTHVQENGRMTLLFCAFEGKPYILRLYGNSKVFHSRDSDWNSYISLFPNILGARQVFELEIEMVQSSCGFGVPFFEYKEDRTTLRDWTKIVGDDGIKEYWKEKNQKSLDGKPTNII